MKNSRTKDFRKCFERLPRNIQNQAREAYLLFKADPYYSSLHFECIDRQEGIYSVRIGLHYRALGQKEGDTIFWFFIGSHEEYNRFL